MEDVARFDAEEAEVGEVGAPAFFVELANAAEQALDAEEIFSRMTSGPFQKKPTIATANFQLGGLCRGKQSLQPQRFRHGLKFVQQAHCVSAPTKRAREAV